MNVICYSRVATPDQAQPGQSLDQQKSDLRTYCQLKHYNIIGEYSDVASGSSFNRPHWNNLLEFCKQNKGGIDMIVLTNWSRFSRNIYEGLRQIKSLNKKGIEVYSIDSPLDFSDPANKILRSLYLTMAEV